MLLFWTAAPMTGQGPRKGESSQCSLRNGLRPQPAHSVRGSSRRIMTMRSQPANIRVINRRASYCPAIGPAVQTQTTASGGCVPLRRPSKVHCLPERCSQARVRSAAQQRRALACCAPFRTETYTTGGSAIRAVRKGKGRHPPGGGAGLNQNPVSILGDLTGSLHIRTAAEVPIA
jgi:hypothetical protein